MPEKYFFEKISLLVTHYNRSRSLERLLQSFENINCSFGDIGVSDDRSKPEHIEKIKELQKLHTFRLLTTLLNKGLGNIISKKYMDK